LTHWHHPGRIIIKTKILVASVLASMSIASLAAPTTLAHIDARSSSGTNQAPSAGDDAVSWIGPAQGGSFDAWSARPSGDNRLNAILDTTSAGQIAHGTGVKPWAATPAEALAAAQGASFQLILTSAQNGNFMDADNDANDNRGGVSLNLAAPPEPYAMMLAGLGMMGLIARRRHSI
jgi:hypothetical protein